MAPPPAVKGVDDPERTWGLDIGDGDLLPLICGECEWKIGLPTGEIGHDMFLGDWDVL